MTTRSDLNHGVLCKIMGSCDICSISEIIPAQLYDCLYCRASCYNTEGGCSVFSVLRDGFKITGGKKWMIRCLLRELCSMRQITGQTQHPPCSYIIVRGPPPPSPANMVQSEISNVAALWTADCWLLLLFPSGWQMLILPGLLSPGQEQPGQTTQYLYPANFTTN